MESLPGEIKADILVRLPIKTLCKLKCVSKPWRSLIISPHFTKAHLNRSSSSDDDDDDRRRPLLVSATSSLHTLNLIHNVSPRFPPPPVKLQLPSPSSQNLGPIELVGSSNGIICLYFRASTFALLNPTTKEFRVLPDPGSFPPDANLTLAGFGYVESADDYMVIKITTDNTGVRESMARLFSAKSNCWKTIHSSLPFRVFPWVKPVYVNGVVHWLGFGGKFPPVHKIIGFDFIGENFKILPLPDNVNQKSIKCLGVLGGCLCIFSRKFDPPNLEMWEMLDYGVRESWTKTITIPKVHDTGVIEYLFPVAYVKDKILMWVQNRSLVLYDPVEWRYINLDVNLRDGKGALDVTSYEESLVSPYGYIMDDEERQRRG